MQLPVKSHPRGKTYQASMNFSDSQKQFRPIKQLQEFLQNSSNMNTIHDKEDTTDF